MFLLHFFIVLLICNKIVPMEIECPLECNCDMYKGFRRATCINRSLIVVDIDIPPQVEILDLSYNLINELPDHIFHELNLLSLRLLNLSHNKIDNIHMNAFYGINKIKTIDLSYNTIEYLLKNWFWNLPELEELYLQGNNLRMLYPVPILDSQSIRILNFGGCSILEIHEDAFKTLPNLEVLDLSNNALIQLKVETIKPLSKLKTLAIDDNPWHCNNVINDLITYCKKNGIKSKDPCVKTVTPKDEKFQRMIVEPTSDSTKQQNSWIIETKTVEENENKVCAKTNETEIPKSLLVEIIEFSLISTLCVFYIFGVISGLFMACIIHCITATCKKSITSKKPKRRNRKFADLYDDPLLQSDVFVNADSTPIPLRKIVFHQT